MLGCGWEEVYQTDTKHLSPRGSSGEKAANDVDVPALAREHQRGDSLPILFDARRRQATRGIFLVRKKIYEMKMRVEGSHLTTRVSAIAKEVFNGFCLSCRRRAQQSSLEAS